MTHTISEKIILFNDIVGSTKLWKKYNSKMFNELNRVMILIHELLKKYKNSFIVKMMGDSFMIVFDSIVDSIDFTIKLENKLKTTESYLGLNHRLHFRTGIYAGKVIENELIIQQKLVKDFFGNVVNISGLIEKRFAKPDSISIGFTNKSKLIEIIRYLNNKKYHYEIIDFKTNCTTKRESYHMSSTKNVEQKCKNIKTLKKINHPFKILTISNI